MNPEEQLLHDIFAKHDDWGDYPNPHYDEYDDCMCPDHRAMRRDNQNDSAHTLPESEMPQDSSGSADADEYGFAKRDSETAG